MLGLSVIFLSILKINDFTQCPISAYSSENDPEGFQKGSILAGVPDAKLTHRMVHS